MNPTPLPQVARVVALGLALLLSACGNSAQKKAYEHAATMEQQVAPEKVPAVIAEYQEVIRLEPGSSWAKKAQARVEILQAKVKAEELHKSVFQEHGID